MTQVLQKPGFKIKQHYLTWDNGGKPFLVKINENNEVETYTSSFNDDYYYDDDTIFSEDKANLLFDKAIF